MLLLLGHSSLAVRLCDATMGIIEKTHCQVKKSLGETIRQRGKSWCFWRYSKVQNTTLSK